MPGPYSIDEMADRFSIYDLYVRYVHSADCYDLAGLENVFVPETVFDLTECGYKVMDWDTAKVDDMLGGRLFAYAFHLCGNILIEFSEDRNAANVKSKTINPMGVRDASGAISVYQVQGGYDDVLSNTVQGWRIIKRRWRQGRNGWISGGMPFVDSIEKMLSPSASSISA